MNLEELLAGGLSILKNDPQGDLRPGFRCRVYRSFEETDTPQSKKVGLNRRVKLATLTIEKVMSLWEVAFPTDRTPHQALACVENILAGSLSTTAAEQEGGRLWAHCDDLSWRHEDKQSVIMVGYGAVQAIREASSADGPFGCEQVDESTTDIDVDPYTHDSAFCAAIAYSGGVPWQTNSDVEKRREFWTWWLTSAVRVAMASS
jgi:hypothetical protein